jgi:putative restriction endonuclease
VDKFEEGKELVYSYNWASLQNPFEFASDGATYEEIITALAENPDTAIDIMRLVKTRGVAQRMFRDALLRAYQGRCAFTDISFEATLEACHIIPWSSCRPEQRLDVRNGILLNSVHHKLFDNGLVTVTQDFQIWYADPNMQAGPYSEYDRLLSAQLHGTKMRMPISAALWPGHDYLEQSHKLHGWVDCLPPGKGVGTNLGIESAVRFGKLNDGKAPIPESQRGAS